MEDVKFMNINGRINRLERQNLYLKIIVLAGLFILAVNFVVTKTTAKDSVVVAQKFVLIDDKGNDCGYLGYDLVTKNPRLSLNECGGTPEMIGLMIDKDSPLLKLDALGRPTATLATNRANGNATLNLESNVAFENTAGVAYMSSGSSQSAPQLYLEGREKGRVDLFMGGDYFRISDEKSLKRFSIDKTNLNSVALHFYDKNGSTETFRVPPIPPTKSR